MPFTLSHTLAVMPFRRYGSKFFSMSGLLMGSMAPDFEFFVRITLYGVWGHTYWGILLFDLPLSLFLCFLFHYVVKNVLILHLPHGLHKRFSKYLFTNWIDFFVENPTKIIISILIGIITHFVWDNFTHEPNYVSPIYFDFLLYTINLFDVHIPVYQLLQLGSSLIGMAGFLLVILMMPSSAIENPISAKEKIKYWLSVLLSSIAIIAFRYMIGVPNEKPFEQLIVISIAAFLISLTLVSVFFTSEKPFIE